MVALETDPSWNRNPRLGAAGFDLRGFPGRTVDSFWLHLLIELGTAGLVAYLLWLWLLVRPLLSARADPIVQCGIALVAFVTIVGGQLAESPPPGGVGDTDIPAAGEARFGT